VNRRTETGVMMMTTERVHVGTRPTTSLHQRSTAKDTTKIVATCVTSSVVEMHASGLKTSAKIRSVKGKNSAKKGTMITMTLTMTDLSRSGTYPRGRQGVLPRFKAGPMANEFQDIRIEKYDESTNLFEWFEVYQLATEAAEGDSYVMANYLPVCLSSSARTWLLGLPVGSFWSWNHLRRMFTSNFHATCAWSRVDWDLANVVQEKGESL
jgi:hypothetical protein